MFHYNTFEIKEKKITPILRSIIISCYCQETCGPLTLFKLINNITNKITHIPCACERCIFNNLNKFLTQKLKNFVIFLGYESTKRLGTNRPKVGTKRLSLGTKRLGTKRPWVRNDWRNDSGMTAPESKFQSLMSRNDPN